MIIRENPLFEEPPVEKAIIFVSYRTEKTFCVSVWEVEGKKPVAFSLLTPAATQRGSKPTPTQRPDGEILTNNNQEDVFPKPLRREGEEDKKV